MDWIINRFNLRNIMGKRGRPKELPHDYVAPTKFTREVNYEDGTKQIWYYDLNITGNGPVNVEIIHPKNVLSFDDMQEQLPKIHRQYVYEDRLVGYQRAKTLKLI